MHATILIFAVLAGVPFHWDAVPDADGYELHWGCQPYSERGSIRTLATTIEVEPYPCLASGHEAPAIYWVTAYNEHGDSPESNLAWTEGPHVPDAPPPPPECPACAIDQCAALPTRTVERALCETNNARRASGRAAYHLERVP